MKIRYLIKTCRKFKNIPVQYFKIRCLGKKRTFQLFWDLTRTLKTIGGIDVSVLPWAVPETFLYLKLCTPEDIQISDKPPICMISQAALQFPSESAVQVNKSFLQMRKPVFGEVKEPPEFSWLLYDRARNQTQIFWIQL